MDSSNSRIGLNVDMACSEYDFLAKEQRALKLEGQVRRIFMKMRYKFPNKIDYTVQIVSSTRLRCGIKKG